MLCSMWLESPSGPEAVLTLMVDSNLRTSSVVHEIFDSPGAEIDGWV